MKQQVFFDDIKQHIIENIRQSQYELKIAVAWLTDTEIIKEIDLLLKKNVSVEIIIYDDHINKKDLYKSLYYNNTKIFLSKNLMHNKFCIIDNKTVINGSYNWTLKASLNEENIQITYDNYEFADRFNAHFNKLSKTCKTIDSFFEYSLENLNDLQNKFQDYLTFNKQPKFPYFYHQQELILSETNKFYTNFKSGYYLIQNELEEENFYKTKYFLQSNFSLYKINQIYNTKSTLPQFYDYVDLPNLKNENIFFFKKENYRVEIINKHKYVFYIDKKNNIVGNKIQFTDKLPNGLYLQNFSNIGSTKNIIDQNLKKHDLKMISIELNNEIGIFGKKQTEKFEKEFKYGLKDFNNQNIIDFEYDHYEINKNSCEVSFIEFPHFKKEPINDKLINITKDPKYYKDAIHKSTVYNYSTKKITQKSKLINLNNLSENNFIFLSDENEYYFGLYMTIRYYPTSKFKFLNLHNLSFSKFLEFKNEYKKELSPISFLERQERILEIKESFFGKNNTNHKKEGCYVATMVYGNYNHPNVIILRKFRDNTLNLYLLGRIFITLYYKYSPNYVNYIKNKKYLSSISTFIVKSTVYLIKRYRN